MSADIWNMEHREMKDKYSALAFTVFFLYCIVNFVGGFVATFSNQTCHNCWNGFDCSVHYNLSNITWPVTRDQDCWELCDQTEDCNVATLGPSGYCNLYNCSQVSQKLGEKTFRKTNNSDCLDFEIYVHTGYEGNCTAIIKTESNSYTPEHCLERCLETPSCRSTTYDESLSKCYHSNGSCTDMNISNTSTFVERKCLNDPPVCRRNYTQTCVNCKTDDDLCPLSLDSMREAKPLTINTSILGEDPDVKQIWYASHYTSVNYVQCTYVKQQVGNSVYRATCTQDCPKFEILTLPYHKGTCSEIHSLSGGMGLEFCMDKCLDMENCREVSLNRTEESCIFHDCTNYTRDNGHHFMARRCMEEGPECQSNSTIIQTCLGCERGPDCPSRYEVDSSALYTNCLDIKATDNESMIVFYNRSQSRCKRYQCSQIGQQMSSIVYRESCNTDCPKFEIFQLRDYGGTCEIIHSEEGGFTFPYCIDKCLDMDGCRGTTFNSTFKRCDYHNCSNHTASPGVRFMWKRCIFYEPPRDYQQICVGCTVNKVCQMPANQTYLPTWQECQTYFNTTDVSNLYMYDTNTSACQLINCTLVEQDENMYLTVFRKSPSFDCPIFRLFTLYGYNGTCPIIGYDEGGVDLAYCIDKCLDMDGCRAVSHDNQKLQCFYHTCTERYEGDSNHTFVKRECMTYQEFNPTKDYIQTCKNCQNMCHSTLSTQPNQQLAYNCNTTCTDCVNVMYEPISDQCLQYQCDRPYVQGQGTTMIRKTTNQECLNFELMPKLLSISTCIPFDFDEGVANAEFCIKRCLDLEGCLALFFDPDFRNCTYHACSDYETGSSTGILFIKNCSIENECPASVRQMCLNCQQGSLCQTPFYNTTSPTGGSCQAVCDTEPFCEGLSYRSDMRCELYQCSSITQLFGSSFYRESCNKDCPLYEVYILDGYKGSCDIIASMTEYMVLYPEICYERCLDSAICRAVTYSPSTEICYYHSCDCHRQYNVDPGDTFMWKYCLNDVSSFTILPQFSSSNGSSIDIADIYPTATNCTPEPIYTMPCFCSSGIFANLTNQEIVLLLLGNMAVDADSTSLHFRKYNSAVDNRPVAVVFGSFGLAVLVSVIATVVVMDFNKISKIFGQIYRRILKLMKKMEKNGIAISGPVSSESIESIQHYYVEDLGHLLNSQKGNSERKLSIISFE